MDPQASYSSGKAQQFSICGYENGVFAKDRSYDQGIWKFEGICPTQVNRCCNQSRVLMREIDHVNAFEKRMK